MGVWACEKIQVISKQAAYIVADILSGNTQKEVNPYWSEWLITDANGKRRPAGYKTGTTSDFSELPTMAARAAPSSTSTTPSRRRGARSCSA